MEEKIEMYITEKAAQEEATEKSYNERIMEVKKMKYEKKAFDKLMELGVPANLLGYNYLKYAIAAAAEDEHLIRNMTKVFIQRLQSILVHLLAELNEPLDMQLKLLLQK